MKIAIHYRKGSFSDGWIEYCKENSIDYKIVNAYSSDIIEEVRDCEIFMWHHSHTDYRDVFLAKKILFALEHSGTKVFPNFNTGWHFDDKVAQKYLLEAIDAPLVKSFSFVNKNDALDWINSQRFPLVFKLKGGAGARNVKLLRNKRIAVKFIKKSFNTGFNAIDRSSFVKDVYRQYRLGRVSFKHLLNAVYRYFIPTISMKMMADEKGYIYFQEFIPENYCDFRVKVIGERVWAFKRAVRKGDFRASGSGDLIFNHEEIPLEMLKIARDVAKKLKLQCVAFDFVLDKNQKPLIVEMSYGFGWDDRETSYYWDKDYNINFDGFNPAHWIIEDLINEAE